MRRLSGFSLMEMMIVLLIVAIVAAASAPMVTKKLVEDQEGSDCPWTWTNNDSIFFNGDGNNTQAVIIGDDSLPANTNSKLFIKSTGSSPHIILNNGNSANDINIHSLGTQRTLSISSELAKQVNTTVIGHNISLGENASSVTLVGSQSTAKSSSATAIGHHATAAGMSTALGTYSSAGAAAGELHRATAIGAYANASSSNSIAIGVNAYASASNSIAIGSSNATTSAPNATGMDSIAIGRFTKASNDYATAIGYASASNHISSVAIGHNAKTTAINQIVLGRPDDTVYIPGNLRVNGDVELAVSSGKIVKLRASHGNNAEGQKKFGYVLLESNGSGLFINETASTLSSDRRLKNVGKAFVGGLEELKKLDLFHYTYKKDPVKTPHVGVMAQDLQKIFPNAVVKGDDGFLRIRMEDMFYAVINAVIKSQK